MLRNIKRDISELDLSDAIKDQLARIDSFESAYLSGDVVGLQKISEITEDSSSILLVRVQSLRNLGALLKKHPFLSLNEQVQESLEETIVPMLLEIAMDIAPTAVKGEGMKVDEPGSWDELLLLQPAMALQERLYLAHLALVHLTFIPQAQRQCDNERIIRLEEMLSVMASTVQSLRSEGDANSEEHWQRFEKRLDAMADVVISLLADNLHSSRTCNDCDGETEFCSKHLSYTEMPSESKDPNHKLFNKMLDYALVRHPSTRLLKLIANNWVFAQFTVKRLERESNKDIRTKLAMLLCETVMYFHQQFYEPALVHVAAALVRELQNGLFEGNSYGAGYAIDALKLILIKYDRYLGKEQALAIRSVIR